MSAGADSCRGCGACLPPRPARATAPRRAVIERLWAQGRTVGEIGELMGWAENARESKISRLRQLGYHLPHRRRATP